MTSTSPSRGSGYNSTPRPSRIISQQIAARDITAVFTQAATKLPTGQLVKDEYFTLFEAVGALEIGDPKMDSGYLAPGESMDDDYNVLRDLQPAEVIGIMDQMLCQEVAWHAGNPLSQTVFTSIYIDRLLWPEPRSLEQAQFSRTDVFHDKPLVHRVLRAYCLGLIKASDFILVKITSEHYYEEEDFSSQTYNRPLLHNFGASKICHVLDEALSWLEPANIDSVLKSALEKRLLFRKELLLALESDTKGPEHRKAAQFRNCVLLLQEIKASSHSGTPVLESFSSKIQRRLASSVPPRPMITVSTDTAFYDFQRFCNDAADADQVLMTKSNGSLLTAITTFMARSPQPPVYIRALIQSLVYHGDQAFGKQSMRKFIYSDLDALTMPGNILLREQGGNSPIDGHDITSEAEGLLGEFVDRVGLVYINMFRTICLNRARFRRTLCHAVLDFDSVQADAEDLDTTLRDYTGEQPLVFSLSPNPTFAYPLSSWMYHYKLRQLEQVIQMGFELSVYAPDELPMMYWYLSHICSTHLSHLDRISFFVEKHSELRSRNLHSSNARSELQTRVNAALRNLDRQFVQVRAADALARALHLLYAVLDRHKFLPKPSRPYSTDKLRYELRMRPFLPLSIPEPISYEDYVRAASLVQVNDKDMLESAARSVADARKGWEEVLAAKWIDETIDVSESVKSGGTSLEAEWTKDVKNTSRACIATSIAIAALKKKLDEASSTNAKGKKASSLSTASTVKNQSSKVLQDLKVEIPLVGEKGCWHNWWIVPKIS